MSTMTGHESCREHSGAFEGRIKHWLFSVGKNSFISRVCLEWFIVSRWNQSTFKFCLHLFAFVTLLGKYQVNELSLGFFLLFPKHLVTDHFFLISLLNRDQNNKHSSSQDISTQAIPQQCLKNLQRRFQLYPWKYFIGFSMNSKEPQYSCQCGMCVNSSEKPSTATNDTTR